MKSWFVCVAAILLLLAGFFTATFGVRAAPPVVSTIAILVLAAPTLVAFIYWRRMRAVFVIFALGLFAYGIETLGVLTGFPYGAFQYNSVLGAQLGVVPWSVFFAWTPLIVGAYALVSRHVRNTYERILLIATLLTVFDLVLDPGAVKLGFWQYVHDGVYYGVPFTNYLGWMFSGTIGAMLLLLSERGLRRSIPPVSLAWSVFLSMTFWASVSLTLGMVIPAVIGVFVAVVYGFSLIRDQPKRAY